MKKIIELLKADLLDILRRPANLFFALVMAIGILLLTGFVLNTGTTADIIASYSVFLAAYAGFIVSSMAILTDKDNGLYRMYRSSKLSKAEYITSKVIYSSLGLLLSLLVILIGYFTTEIYLSVLIPAILILSLMSHLGIGLLIPLFVETAEEAQRIVSFIFFAMIFVSPVFYTGDVGPEVLTIVQQLIPLTQGIDAMRSVLVEGLGLELVWKQLVLLTGLTAVTFTAGYRKLDF